MNIQNYNINDFGHGKAGGMKLEMFEMIEEMCYGQKIIGNFNVQTENDVIARVARGRGNNHQQIEKVEAELNLGEFFQETHS